MTLTLRTHSWDSHPTRQRRERKLSAWDQPTRKNRNAPGRKSVRNRYTLKQDLAVMLVVGLLGALATLRKLTRVWFHRSMPLSASGLS